MSSNLPVLSRSDAGDLLVKAELGDERISNETLRAIARADASYSFRALSVIGRRVREKRPDGMTVMRGVILTSGERES